MGRSLAGGGTMTRTEAVRLLTEKGCTRLTLDHTFSCAGDTPEEVNEYWEVLGRYRGLVVHGVGDTLEDACDEVVAEVDTRDTAPTDDEDQITRGNYG